MMSNIQIKRAKEFIKQRLEEIYKTIDEDWIIIEKYLNDFRTGEYWIEFSRKEDLKNYIIFYGDYTLEDSFKKCRIKIRYNEEGDYESVYSGKITFEKINAVLGSLNEVEKLSGRFQKIIKESERNE
jgi:hypothetical protein